MTMLHTLCTSVGASGKGIELALKLNALYESLTSSSAVAASGAKALQQAVFHASSSSSRSTASTAPAATAPAATAPAATALLSAATADLRTAAACA